MVTLGADTHKRSHTLVAVDEGGRQLASIRVAATMAGHLELLEWSQRWPERQWALEDCRPLCRHLERELLALGEAVVRVPPKMMSATRRSGREAGKSDPVDALAVARAAQREQLPRAQLEGVEREIRLLVDHRENLVKDRTRIQNRLHWALHSLDPEFRVEPGTLDRNKVQARVGEWLATRSGLEARLALEELARIRELTMSIRRLDWELEVAVKRHAPGMLELVGCGPLSAAKLLGEVAGVRRFRSEAAFARQTGTAPIPVWSGAHQRHRLSRGGNRQLNAVLHRIAVTQLRMYPPAQAYMAKRKAMGNSKREALRALKRHLSDVVYRHLMASARAIETATTLAA